MRKLKTSAITGLALALGTTLAASSVKASETFFATPAPDQSAFDGANQSMEKQILLQSMKRDACFKMAGIAGKDFGTRVSATVTEMKQSLTKLRAQHQTSGGGLNVVDQLDAFDTHWDTLAAALQQVSAGDFHAVPLQQILTLEPQAQGVLEDIHVSFVAQDAGIRTKAQQDTGDILLQKMQIQKLTKEACLVLRDISAEDNLTRLLVTEAQFGRALEASVAAARGPERARLDDLKATWQEFTDLLKTLKGEAEVSDTDKLRLSVLSDDLVEQLTALEQL